MTDTQTHDAERTRSKQRRVVRDLEYVREAWGDLQESRFKGTARPWAEQLLTDDQRHAADQLALVERKERAYGIGEHPAPLHIDVLDTILAVTAQMLELEAACRDALGFKAAKRASQFQPGQPSGVTHWAAVWIVDALPAIGDKPDLLDHVSSEAHLMAQTVRSALGESPSSIIKAPCLACSKMTLRFYTVTERVADAYVLCTNRECDPDPKVCGGRLRGFAFWPFHELEWLSDKLDEAAAAVRCDVAA